MNIRMYPLMDLAVITLVAVTLTLPLCSAPAYGDDRNATMESGLRNFSQENFEEALDAFLQVRLESLPAHGQGGAMDFQQLESLPVGKDQAEVVRLLGLTYFHLNRYREARTALTSVLEFFQRDESIMQALAEIELADGNPRRALDYLQLLKQMVAYKPQVRWLEGRALAAMGQDYDAMAAWQLALQLSSAARDYVALPLLQAYVRSGRIEAATRLLADAATGDALGLDGRRDQVLLQQLARLERALVGEVGLRLENDSNVALLPQGTPVSSNGGGKRDDRWVLTGDLLYRQEFNPYWALYHEAHLYASRHDELRQFDTQRLAYVFSPAYSQGRWGLRFPVGLEQQRLDGSTYLSAYRSSPGAYLRWTDTATVMGYLRAEVEDISEAVAAEESRSGSYRGLGMYGAWFVADHRAQLRANLQRGHRAADGANWARAETAYLLQADYRFSPPIKGGIAWQGSRQDYDHVHSIFAARRQDRTSQWSLLLQYAARRPWEYQLQYVASSQHSNIDVYSYRRNVLTLGVLWRMEAQ